MHRIYEESNILNQGKKLNKVRGSLSFIFLVRVGKVGYIPRLESNTLNTCMESGS